MLFVLKMQKVGHLVMRKVHSFRLVFLLLLCFRNEVLDTVHPD